MGSCLVHLAIIRVEGVYRRANVQVCVCRQRGPQPYDKQQPQRTLHWVVVLVPSTKTLQLRIQVVLIAMYFFTTNTYDAPSPRYLVYLYNFTTLDPYSQLLVGF